MPLKITKYEKGIRNLPVKLEEIDISSALLGHEITVDEAIEINDYFELTADAFDLALDIKRVPDEVINWLKKDSLLEFVFGITFIDGTQSYCGYISEESVDTDKITKNKIITVIEWFKYLYNIVGEEPCPKLEFTEERLPIVEWLKFVFMGDVISNVVVSLDVDSTTGVIPYIDKQNYEEYSPFMSINNMLDNICEKGVCVFGTNSFGVLSCTQYDKTNGTSTDITKKILNTSYVETELRYSDYDTVLTEEHGAYFYHRKINNEVISFWGGENKEIKSDDWKILDLTQSTSTFTGLDVAYDLIKKSDNVFEVTTGASNSAPYGPLPPTYNWIGKTILIPMYNYPSVYHYTGKITDVNYYQNEITIAWRDGDNVPWINNPIGDKLIAFYLVEIEEFVPETLEWFLPSYTMFVNFKMAQLKNHNVISTDNDEEFFISKTGALYKSPSSTFGYHRKVDLPNKTAFDRLFQPKTEAVCTVGSVDVAPWQEVTIDGVDHKVLAAYKTISPKVKKTELLLEIL